MNQVSSNSAAISFDQQVSTVGSSRAMVWAGRIITAFAVVFLLFDSAIKVLQLAPAVEATVKLGYPEQLVFSIGVLQLVCLAVYVLPRTSVLGAVLLTGYLGGAVAAHVQNGSDLFSLVFPILIGALLWGGLLLRDHRLRMILPLQR